MSKVSVVVVTYNRLSLLKECIDHLINQDIQLEGIFVVNNNSSDGTKEYLDEISDSTVVHPIHLKENIGGAGGFLYGISYAYSNSKSDYFLIMDDDTMVEKNTISKLEEAATRLNNKFGFLCSNVRWYKDNTPSFLNIPVVSKDWTNRSQEGLIKLTSASFVSFFTTREVIKKVGLPISEMFIWADDVEYSTRISSMFESYFVSDSTVIHKCKTNDYGDSIVNCDVNRIKYYECMFRNRIYIYKKYYNKSILILHFLNYLLNVFKIIFKSKKFKLKRSNAVLKGCFKGIFFNPKIKFPKE